MRKIISTLVILTGILSLCYVIYNKPDSTKDARNALTSVEPTEKELGSLKVINDKANKVTTLSAKLNIKLITKQGNLPLEGEIHFKRPNCMRLIIKSHDATIIDVGSNDTHFWYYMGTISENVYCGNTENVKYYSMPLNPYWIAQGFGMQDLEITGKFFRDLELKNGDTVTLYVSKLGKFVKSMQFDDHLKYLTTFKIYDDKNEEVFHFHNSLLKNELPSVVGLSFVNGSEFQWVVSNHVINDDVPDSRWVMPNKKKVFIR